MPLTMRVLKLDDIHQMFLAFTDAYKDYPFGVNMDEPKFIHRFVHRIGIDFDFSVGVFLKDTLLAFCYTVIGNHKGIKTAYNCAIGVRNAYRGQQLPQAMYTFLLPKLRKANILRCTLEVLKTNAIAIHSYRKIGFTEKSELHTLHRAAPNLSPMKCNSPYTITKVIRPRWDTYAPFGPHPLTFMDCNEQTEKNLHYYGTLELHVFGHCIGYILYQRATARIHRLGIDPKYRRQGYATVLLREVGTLLEGKALTVAHIDENADDLMAFFKKTGFVPYVNYIAMEMDV